MTHKTCNQCQNDLLCGEVGECMAKQPEALIPASSSDIPRSLDEMESRRIMASLSPGERFMLMFGAGRHDRASGKVVPVEKTV